MIEHVRDHVLPAAFALLPSRMRSPGAEAMMLAIGLQESRFLHRRQINGPARGFWQFEEGGGVRGVLAHHSSAVPARAACEALRYRADTAVVYDAITDNDTLAACFARLLLWTYPGALPARGEAGKGWTQYMACWRPGKPHRETWDSFFADAWDALDNPRKDD